MVKFLISLMFLASSWTWGAEVLPHGGAAEAKAEVKMVKLTRGEDSFMVLPDRLAPFKLLASMLEDDIPGDKNIELPERIVTGVAFDFLKVYLDNPEAALANLASYSGDQIVDIMIMLNYLNTDLDSSEVKKLDAALINQLKDNLSPDVLQMLYKNLWMIPGLNLSQTIPGTSASWSPDGSKLWVNFRDHGVYQIQLYQVAADRLVAVGVAVPGISASWSPDGSKLWVKIMDDGVFKFQLYQVANEGLVAIGEVVPGDYTGFSPDGSKLWVARRNYGIDRVQVYQVANEGLVAVGAAVPGGYASWSPDGSKLWVLRRNNGIDQGQVYQIIGNRLEVLLSDPVLGVYAGWSPDGSKLWVARRNNGIDQVQVYQIIGNRLEVLLSDPVPGTFASWSSNGSKLWVSFRDDGVPKIQLYQVAADRLVAVSVAVPGLDASWSPDGSKLWVKIMNDGVFKFQLYQVANEGLVAIGEVVPGLEVGWSSNGSKMWTQLKDGITYKIQLYQAIGNRLEALLSEPAPGYGAGFSPDGSKLFISNNLPDHTTVYFNIFLIHPDLSLAQQMFLVYVLNAHQRTGVTYNLPVGLKEAWSFLPDKLKSYLLEKNIVIVNRPTVRSHDAAGLDDEPDEGDAAHANKVMRKSNIEDDDSKVD